MGFVFPPRHGVKPVTVRMEGQKAGGTNSGRQSRLGKSPALRVKGRLVDSLGTFAAGAEKNISGLSVGRGMTDIRQQANQERQNCRAGGVHDHRLQGMRIWVN